jgi:DNA repair protein RadD
MRWLSAPPDCDRILRPYQRQMMVEAAAQIEAGHNRILIQGATGCGKTHVIASVVKCADAAGFRVLILATRTRIIRQLHERLEQFGIRHGVLAAPLPELIEHSCTVQVASVDTLYRRALVDKRMPLPTADVVIFDEAHLALGESRVAILEQYPDAIHFGFSATPAKLSGRTLRERFDTLVLGPPVSDLIALQALVRARIFNAPVIEQSELNQVERDSKSGDYTVVDLAERMSRPKLVGDVLQNWLRIAHGKRTLVFACNKKHGAALAQEFLKAGVAAELLTDQDSEPDREAAIYRLETGKTKVICNCFLMSYGVDVPSVECIVLARPTRSVVLYLQSVGRGMRPSPGKEHVIVIDHGHVIESLGLPHGDFGWSLDDVNVNQRARAEVSARAEGAEKLRTCPECKHLWLVSEEGPGCGCCGWAPKPKPMRVGALNAQLREMIEQPPGSVTVWDPQVQRFYQEALGYRQTHSPQKWAQKPKSVRWGCWCATRERFEFDDTVRIPGRFWELSPTSCSTDVAGWLKYRDIKWDRARGVTA